MSLWLNNDIKEGLSYQMRDRDEWLTEIKLFPTAKGEFHLYLGSYSRPRSTMVIIRGKRLRSPIFVPPLSMENLCTRYDKLEIDMQAIHPTIRYILSLYGLIDPTIQFDADKSDKPETEYDLSLINWKDFQESSPEKLYLPYNNEIVAQMKGETLLDEILYFDRILSNPDRNLRQKALTNLVKSGNTTSAILIFLLFQLRDELMLAIVRELGRQGRSIQFVKGYAMNMIGTEDKSYHRFGLYYLLQFHHETILDHSIMDKWRAELAQYKFYTLTFRHSGILRDLEKPGQTGADALHIFEKFDVLGDTLFWEVRNFMVALRKSEIQADNLRPGLVDLVQYAEITRSTNMLGIVMAICSLDDRLTVHQEPTLKTELNRTYRHIRDRITSILKLWTQISREDLVEQTLSSYFQSVPSIAVNTTDFDESIFEQWVSSHPILQEFDDVIARIISREEDIVRISINLTISDHAILEYITRNFLRRNQLAQHYTFETVFAISNQYEPNISETVELKKIVTPQDVTQLPKGLKLLSSATNLNSTLAPNLFRMVLENLGGLDDPKLDLLIDFLSHTSRLRKELVPKYFNIISKYVDNHFDSNQTDPMIIEIITNVIVKWQEITGLFPAEEIQNIIDAFKILFQNEIEEFDLETSKPLAIETITECYRLNKGEIPKFIEGNIQFSFTKPVWDQLARHYLALGIERPKREALGQSKLREVPNYLLRDVLGQIALVNQTLSYCEKHGFRPSLENLIINNIYKRGWNVERGLERTLPALLGSTSPRLRSYIATYLAIDQGEISLDILQWARDVEDYLLRDRIVRELERYGTPEMWVTIANAYHPDIRKKALDQLRESRTSATQRSKMIVSLLRSPHSDVRLVAQQWLNKYDLQQDHLISLFSVDYKDTRETIIDYLRENSQHLRAEHQRPLYNMIKRVMWEPRISRNILEKLLDLIPLVDETEIKQSLRDECQAFAGSRVQSRVEFAIIALGKLEA